MSLTSTVEKPATAALIERFTPVFEEVAAGAIEREQHRTLAHDAVRRLADSGFTAVRVPVAEGGSGASLGQLFTLLTRLGEADSNLVQGLRAHFATVDALLAAPADQRDRWIPRIVAGEIFGNATTEKGNKVGTNATVLEERDGQLLLNGTKFYSTGSLYADWIQVQADRPAGGSARVLVHRAAPGVELVDDWDGFGQRLTASGTSHFKNVVVDPANVQFHERGEAGTLTSYVQLVLLAAQTGIARAVLRDATHYVRTRTRAFEHGVGDNPQRDPLVQELTGRISAKVFGIQAAFEAAATKQEQASNAEADGELSEEQLIELNVAVAQAQLIISETTLQIATELFEVGGASAASESRRLDRHWRNARVIASHNPLVYRAREIGQYELTGDGQIGIVYIGAANTAGQGQ